MCVCISSYEHARKHAHLCATCLHWYNNNNNNSVYPCIVYVVKKVYTHSLSEIFSLFAVTDQRVNIYELSRPDRTRNITTNNNNNARTYLRVECARWTRSIVFFFISYCRLRPFARRNVTFPSSAGFRELENHRKSASRLTKYDILSLKILSNRFVG